MPISRPGLYEAMLAGGFAANTWQEVLEARRETMQVVEGVIRHAQETGQVRTGDVYGLAQTLWALIHATIVLTKGDEDEGSVEEMADRTARTFLVAAGA